MRIHVGTFVICVLCLLLFNALALNLLSPGSYDCTTQCSDTQNQLKESINRLKQEILTLKQKCSTNESTSSLHDSHSPSLVPHIPVIHMITPTYSCWTQKADLTRLSQTLMHIKNLHWIVVEDSDNKTGLVARFLKKCNLKYTHLNVRTKKELQRNSKEPVWRKSRGVEQRNLGLNWLRRNHMTMPGKGKGDVVYFGDDDNTYDIELFDEIRATRKLSVWPVGICGGLRWEGPVCDDKGTVVDWHRSWAKLRPFPIDFAGFAIKLDVVLQFSTAEINPDSRIGWLESDFLSQMVQPSDAEGRASNCKKVLVWHTRTEKPKTKDEERLIAQGQPSDPLIET
ncbi:PREDICTED: galactosylgalactosylxylosylprotein 3-beta-glucuronosyltransferase 3-like [Amphimedon queenslandica]|uniref:Galactosylgalactosylxylosylprotein 3-beta-glucuronosyltransferase n=1 Tax=Amphimedon queenslandica TaxID=400682 RepID=A0AAN0J3I7_AMPQE|nr:PREDICTED: galactosylgalactosylxylosylprotein 3-beta-glucuronosyltransferase 3-like [Amphimedon queenslandica]|eukprot:XP_019851580.1 PREDICTED: galactosylgalactosylxylosylprotein 3-beta-glucuronosyltransferase 3-like [Amphimedon queenslandica]